MAKNENIKFSVIIPLYNGAKFIEKTLGSVLEQSYRNFEIVMVNDGSPDNVGDVVKKYMKAHPKIEFIYVEQKNRGLGGARNTAIRNATGNAIAILDQDDIWYPQKLQKVFDVFNNDKDVDVVGHNCYIRKNGKIAGKMLAGPNEAGMHRQMLFKGNRLTTLTTTFKKSVIDRVGNFSEDIKNIHFVEDYDLWLRMALAGCKFYFMSDFLAEYVQHNENYSLNSLERMSSSEIYVLDRHYQLLPKRNFLDAYRLRRRKAEASFLPAYKYILSGRYLLKGLRMLLKTFAYDPFFGLAILRKVTSRIKRSVLMKGAA